MKRKPKLRPEDYFIQIYKVLLDEPAWLALPPGARCLCILLRSYYNGSNNGELFLSVREAARRLNCSPSAVQRWFGDLQEKGFIRPAIAGRLGVGGRGQATCWILTEIGYRGKQPTRDYRNWKTESRT